MTVFGGGTLFGGNTLFGGEPVPFLFLQVDAETTLEARRLMAEGATNGLSLRATRFQVGRGGFDPNDYLAALPVNPAATALDDFLFEDRIDYIEWANDWALSYYCVLETGEANQTLGEVAIIGEVQNSPGTPADGTEVIMAIGHFPLIAKNNTMRYALRVTMQA